MAALANSAIGIVYGDIGTSPLYAVGESINEYNIMQLEVGTTLENVAAIQVALATAATIIASQAVISGAFSLTSQAVQLGYLPRMEIQHTSETRGDRSICRPSTGP